MICSARFITLCVALVLFLPAHAEDPSKAIAALELAVDTGKLDVYIGTQGGDIGRVSKGRDAGLAGIANAIKPALAAARSPDLRKAIKEYYVAAETYFNGALSAGSLNGQRLESDLAAKEAALDLELTLAK